MSLKQEILNEIKKMLHEQTYMPVDDTTGVGNRIPSEHKAFIKKLFDVTRPYDTSNIPFSKFLASFDAALRNGSDTDNIYQNFIKDNPSTKNNPNLVGKQPANFSYKPSGAAGAVQGRASQGTGTGQNKRPQAVSGPKKYFVCKVPAEIEATKNFQKSKGLTPDGKIGSNTFTELVLDPTIKSGGVDFASKGIKLPQLIGNKDPKMKEIYQRSVCEALAKTGAAWITGGNLSTKRGKDVDPTRFGSNIIGNKEKCPSFIKQSGPYTFEEIQQYVPNYLQSAQQGDEGLISAVANAVFQATKRRAPVGCSEVVQFIQGAIKTKGRSVPGLSKIETSEQAGPSTEMDNLNAARAYAKKGVPIEDIEPEILQVGKKYGVFKESKNWIDKTRESAASSLFERLTKDAANKKVI